MKAYDKNDNIVADLQSKEGEPIESFFDKCASIFAEEKVARMQIWKNPVKKKKKEEIEDRIDRPFYRKNRF